MASAGGGRSGRRASSGGEVLASEGPRGGPSKQVVSAVGSISDKQADLRVLIPALVGWSIGVWAHTWTPLSRLVIGALLVALAVLLARWSGLAGLTLAVTALILLTSAQQAWRQSAGPVAELAAAGAVAQVRGQVLAEPIPISGEADEVRVLVRFRVTEVVARGYRTAVSTPVLVRGDERWRRLQWREEVRFPARLRLAQPGSAERAVLVPLGPPEVAVRESTLLAASDRARDGLRVAVDGLPRDARALVPALVVGDTSLTPPDLTEAMRISGMTHLSAVSGSNLAILLTAVMAVVVYTPIRRRWRVLIGLLVIVVFIVVARPEPSVMRAAAMGAVGVIAFSRARAAAGLPALSATIVALLAFDPWLARSYGFALSTLATLGLILFARPWGRAFLRALPARARLPPWVGDALAIPVAAHVMTAPVVVLLQGHVSLVAVVANLLAAPLVAPATLAGALTTLIAPFFPTVGALVAWLSVPPAWLTAQIGRIGATVPGAVIPWPEGPQGALLLAGLLVTAILTGPWLAWVVRRRPLPAGALVLIVVVTIGPVPRLTWPPPDWRVVVCDVGQGDGVVLATGERSAVVIDVGPETGSVAHCLRRLRVESLDAVVLSHFDADHVGGLQPVLDGWPVRELFVSPVRKPESGAVWVEQQAAERNIPVHEVWAGDRLAWDAVSADVWWPARVLHGGSVSNNASVVLAVTIGEPPGMGEQDAGPPTSAPHDATSGDAMNGVPPPGAAATGEPDHRIRALLLGDIESEAGRTLLTTLRREPGWQDFAHDIDLVKTPHHGSANLHAGLMEAVPAVIAVISVGDNDFGHPTRSHLDLFGSLSSVLLRTDEHGDIAVLSPREDGALRWRVSRPP